MRRGKRLRLSFNGLMKQYCLLLNIRFKHNSHQKFTTIPSFRWRSTSPTHLMHKMNTLEALITSYLGQAKCWWEHAPSVEQPTPRPPSSINSRKCSRDWVMICISVASIWTEKIAHWILVWAKCENFRGTPKRRETIEAITEVDADGHHNNCAWSTLGM